MSPLFSFVACLNKREREERDVFGHRLVSYFPPSAVVFFVDDIG